MSGIIGVDLNQRSGVLGGTWNYFKMGTFTRSYDSDGTTDDISYADVGFRPSLIYFIAGGQDRTSRSWGWSDGTNHKCLSTQFALHTGNVIGDACIYVHDTATAGTKASVKTLDSDGFTLTWVDVGDPSVSDSFTFIYTAFR